MLRDRTSESLANEFRSLRALQRPIQRELMRRGFTLMEKHGHYTVPVDGYENIIITKPTTVKL